MSNSIDFRTHARVLRQAIIDMAASGQGEGGADSDILRRFLPLPTHARILEPECMLIIGHRGAGKTELFRVLREAGGPQAIASVSNRIDADSLRKINWCVGYSQSEDMFDHSMVLQSFAEQRRSEDLQFIWLGYLVRTLEAGHLLPRTGLPPELFSETPLETRLENTKSGLDSVISALDRLNRRLEADDEFIFVTYDELDRVSSSNWDALAVIVRGLVQFWSANSRRWKRIRPKIFLRNDLYQKAAIVGPDISKLSANRLRLSWSVKDLYALFFKRLVNQSRDEVRGYFRESLPPGRTTPMLGWMPKGESEADFEPAIERMCGEFMGAHRTKGKTFTWIPTHLQDAHGEVLPRSFLRLFEKASEIENENLQAREPQIIHHSCLRGALDQVSIDRMEELREEFPWIEVFRQHLLPKSITVPIERKELQDQIRIKWDSESPDRRAPFSSSYELIQFLGEFGLFYTRKDGRVDVRDIYLKGLGFKRKGGVQRPF
jgi:energy-coupling factor transporter ATP-binding protein EcfA2